MRVTIKGVEKEISFKEYTRAIEKGYKTTLYKDFNIEVGEKIGEAKFNPLILEEANDYLIINLTDLSEEEVMDMSIKDYNLVLEECKKIQNPPKE